MAKIIAVLYDDPVGGYPTRYARAEVPVITAYPGGQTTPTPEAIPMAIIRTITSESVSVSDILTKIPTLLLKDLDLNLCTTGRQESLGGHRKERCLRG